MYCHGNHHSFASILLIDQFKIMVVDFPIFLRRSIMIKILAICLGGKKKKDPHQTFCTKPSLLLSFRGCKGLYKYIRLDT